MMKFNSNAIDYTVVNERNTYTQFIFYFKNNLVVSVIKSSAFKDSNYNVAVYSMNTYVSIGKFVTDFFDTDSKIFQGTLSTDCQNEIFKVLCNVSNYVKPSTNGKPTS